MSIPVFPKGARVCFVGDSLIARNQYLPVIIETYRKHFPGNGIRFINCGISGGRADFALASFDDDIAARKPTHVLVAFGINDSSRDHLASPRSEYRYGRLKRAYGIYCDVLPKLCKRVKEIGAELILCTPAPYDEYTITEQPSLPGGSALMCEYANFVRRLAEKEGYTLLDFHKCLIDELQTATAPLFDPDHIHPSAHGFYLMAKYLLAEQGIEAVEEGAIPERYAEWREKLFVYRSIHATECMVINNYDLSEEEKVAKIENYLVERKPVGYFDTIAHRWLDFHGKNKELSDEIDRIYDRDILSR